MCGRPSRIRTELKPANLSTAYQAEGVTDFNLVKAAGDDPASPGSKPDGLPLFLRQGGHASRTRTDDRNFAGFVYALLRVWRELLDSNQHLCESQPQALR